jgi:hypothetical protein
MLGHVVGRVYPTLVGFGPRPRLAPRMEWPTPTNVGPLGRHSTAPSPVTRVSRRLEPQSTGSAMEGMSYETR